MDAHTHLAHRAVVALTAVCDGAIEQDYQGWNKPDSTIGHALSLMPPEAWDTVHQIWALSALHKYRAQLTRMGIDIHDLPQPPRAQIATDQIVAVSADAEGNLLIAAPATSRIAGIVREYRHRGVIERDTPGLHWVIPPTTPVGSAIRAELVRVRAHIPDAARRILEQLPDAVPTADVPHLRAIRDGWSITFPRGHRIYQDVRDLPERTFVGGPEPYWHAPTTRSNAEALTNLITRHDDLVVDPSAQERIEQALLHLRECALRLGENGSFWLFFPRHRRDVLDAVRSLPKRRFVGDEPPHWEADLIAVNTLPLRQLVTTYDFEVAADAGRMLDQLRVEVPKPPRRVELYDTTLKVFSPYDESIRPILRQAQGQWDRDEKCYVVPLSFQAIDPIDSLIGRGFVAPDRWEKIKQQFKAEAQQRYEGARAKTADVQIALPGGSLMPFQNAGYAYMVREIQRIGGVINADDMGLGKTLQTIAVIEGLKAYPAVLVVPATLKYNWRNEWQKWLPERTLSILSGQTPDPAQLDAEVIIINYDILHHWVPVIKARFAKLPMLALDEAHYIKNAKRTKKPKTEDGTKKKRSTPLRGDAVFQLADIAERRIALTGTPIKNRVKEIWPLLEYTGAARFFGSFFQFATRYCNARQRSVGSKLVWDFDGASNLPELHTRLRQNGMVRRTKSEVLTELPPKQRTIIPLDLDNQATYNQAETDFLAYLRTKRWQAGEEDDEKSPGMAETIVKMNELRQLAAQGKLKRVIQWIGDFLESGEKLVVFAHHRPIQQALAEAFPNALTITADDSAEARAVTVSRFQQNPNDQLIIASLMAAGVGITLTAASNIAIVELPWTPADTDQAEDRCHRIGQASSVNIWYLLAAGTIDDDMYQTIDRKRGIATQVTDGTAKRANAHIAKDVLKRLKARHQEGS